MREVIIRIIERLDPVILKMYSPDTQEDIANDIEIILAEETKNDKWEAKEND